ncbi:MAG: hypothetical protein L3K18_05870 [Thermoplasmata archaeon]|nr:hypothetical protein [Thermoplasmata archaeon]
MTLPVADPYDRRWLVLGLAAGLVFVASLALFVLGWSAPPVAHCPTCSQGVCPLYCYTTIGDTAVRELQLGVVLLVSSFLVGAAAWIVRWLYPSPLL